MPFGKFVKQSRGKICNQSTDCTVITASDLRGTRLEATEKIGNLAGCHRDTRLHLQILEAVPLTPKVREVRKRTKGTWFLLMWGYIELLTVTHQDTMGYHRGPGNQALR
jgi:hypothetical protein